MKTSIFDWHVKNGGHMVDFHGWDLPLYYTGIMAEHMSVRKKVGIFDVSHMGDIKVSGEGAIKLLESVLPSSIGSIEVGRAAYTAFLNESGNLIDDTIVYRLSEDSFFFVPNAATTDLIYSWVRDHNSISAKVSNVSDKISCFAVQGPLSVSVANDLGFPLPKQFSFDLHEDDFHGYNHITGGENVIFSGTGYTGETGFELIVSNDSALEWWERCFKSVTEHGGSACGLGSRDTLRMEKGMLLSGVDFNVDRDPYECSISFIINRAAGYIGSQSLQKRKETDTEIFRGIILENKLIPRENFSIFHEGEKIGKITSGSLSPILARGIGLGFVNKKFSHPGTEVMVEIRGKMIKGNISRPKMVP